METTLTRPEMMSTDATMVATLKRMRGAAMYGRIRTDEAIVALRAEGWPLARANLRTLAERGEIVIDGETFTLTAKLGQAHPV